MKRVRMCCFYDEVERWRGSLCQGEREGRKQSYQGREVSAEAAKKGKKRQKVRTIWPVWASTWGKQWCRWSPFCKCVCTKHTRSAFPKLILGSGSVGAFCRWCVDDGRVNRSASIRKTSEAGGKIADTSSIYSHMEAECSYVTETSEDFADNDSTNCNHEVYSRA